jgi:hypothetical protein
MRDALDIEIDQLIVHIIPEQPQILELSHATIPWTLMGVSLNTLPTILNLRSVTRWRVPHASLTSRVA